MAYDLPKRVSLRLYLKNRIQRCAEYLGTIGNVEDANTIRQHYLHPLAVCSWLLPILETFTFTFTFTIVGQSQLGCNRSSSHTSGKQLPMGYTQRQRLNGLFRLSGVLRVKSYSKSHSRFMCSYLTWLSDWSLFPFSFFSRTNEQCRCIQAASEYMLERTASCRI